MRPKPSPELAVTGPSENPQGGLSRVVKRAIVIGNGCAGAENQCIGLIRSLGLFDRHLYYVISVQKKKHYPFIGESKVWLFIPFLNVYEFVSIV